MPFQKYEDEIPYVERGSLLGAINYAQKSATESFPADDRRGSNNGGQHLAEQPLKTRITDVIADMIGVIFSGLSVTLALAGLVMTVIIMSLSTSQAADLLSWFEQGTNIYTDIFFHVALGAILLSLVAIAFGGFGHWLVSDISRSKNSVVEIIAVSGIAAGILLAAVWALLLVMS
jgi:hypothetical protein